MNIQLLIEEYESNGEVCIWCKQVIEGKKYVLILQWDKASDLKIHAFDGDFCEKCVTEKSPQ